MFDYVEDKKFLCRIRNLCGGIMQNFCHFLKEDYDIGATFYLVGSSARNLIVQNASLPVQGLPIGTDTIGMKPLILPECRKRPGISRKRENDSLSDRSIYN